MSETKEQVKHTPTPWHVERDDNVVSCDGTLIAAAYGVYPKEYDRTSAASDAEFIVRAVNCHEELLWALKTVLDSMGALSNPTELGGWAISERDQSKIMAAIARAEGRT